MADDTLPTPQAARFEELTYWRLRRQVPEMESVVAHARLEAKYARTPEDVEVTVTHRDAVTEQYIGMRIILENLEKKRTP